MATLNFQLERLATPIGQMLVITDEQHRLRAVDWQDYEDHLARLLGRQYKGITLNTQEIACQSKAAKVLLAYFEGDLTAINTLEVALGGTDFQRQVWLALRDISAGQTCSYKDIALRIGRPAAVRAIGLANGANPISIVLPCHRVIGSNGTLTGYGGGLNRKQWLLNHENPNARY